MPSGQMFSEKRVYKRVPKQFFVKYKIMSSSEKKSPTNERERKIADCFNLSLGGIGLLTDENLSQEQLIAIEFVLEGKEKPITTYAEVRWSKRDEKLDKCRTGIEFLSLTTEDKNFIKKIIHQK